MQVSARFVAAVMVAGCMGTAHAQFNDQWVTFQQNASMLGPSATTISNSNTETDMHWGDLDKDGWIDLVIVRKQPFTSTGKRTNLLLMNENGVLNDRTSVYAFRADVVGDQGFLTATNDRDVQIDDFNQDGWDDFVTATTLSDGDPKHIGHPRIYMNLKNTGSTWNGMRFENSRFPQLIHFSSGQAQNPRFCSVATGDVTGDGYPDLYFGDYDSSGAGGSQQGPNEDLNNRMLFNDGAGFFTDVTQTRLPNALINSAFGAASVIADMNGDSKLDIVRQTALNPPQEITVGYNNFFNVANGDGNFLSNGQTQQLATSLAPYHVNVVDLNNDGRLDVIESDDNSDRFLINTGNDSLGRVVWSSTKTFSFLTGGDDGFASNNIGADLDLDGLADVLICDVDVDIGGCGRRLHIYHNRGGSGPTLREERQSSGSGWVGVVGMTTSQMTGAHDVGIFDVDNDQDLDIILSRCDGTFAWMNLTDPGCPVPMKTGAGEVGCLSGVTAVTSFSGSQTTGGAFTINGTGFGPNQFGLEFSGWSVGGNVQSWGTIWPGPPNFLRTYSTTSGAGTMSLNHTVSAGMVGNTVWFQLVARDGGCGSDVVQAGDAVGVTFCP